MIKFVRMLSFIVFSLMCMGVAAYSFHFLYQSFNLHNGFLVKFASSGWTIPVHFFAGGVALLLVPLQMSRRLRRRSVRVHRTIGMLYALLVLIGGLSGLVMAFYATGGWVAKAGFAMLALAWLSTTTLGVVHAVRGNLMAHRRWIYRSIAITAGAITLRVFLGVGLGVFHLPFLTVYVFASWMSWILNLIICEMMMRFRWKRPQVLAPA